MIYTTTFFKLRFVFTTRKLPIVLIGTLLFTISFLNAADFKPRALPGDSVQAVLHRLSRTSPNLVAYIPETGRLYLVDSRESVLDARLLHRLQDAFYYDINQWCKFYGEKYLMDWRVLVAKASRETCWGTSFLCNRANNYFGIRQRNKPWACDAFRYCEVVVRPDPEPAEFVVFPSFETSLWMFIHTTYSSHFLERLPDLGARVYEAIQMERRYGLHYWQLVNYGVMFPQQLLHGIYTSEDIIYTWSEHPINNLCLNCSRQTDREWVMKVQTAAYRAGI
jgi:hypothetical protein